MGRGGLYKTESLYKLCPPSDEGGGTREACDGGREKINTDFVSLPVLAMRRRQASPLVKGGWEKTESLHKLCPPSDEGGVKRRIRRLTEGEKYEHRLCLSPGLGDVPPPRLPPRQREQGERPKAYTNPFLPLRREVSSGAFAV